MAKFKKTYNRKFVFYLFFTGWDNINLGFSFNWLKPNIEIHLPFCFIRIGWQGYEKYTADELNNTSRKNTFGYSPDIF